jgi:hypothetical protein
MADVTCRDCDAWLAAGHLQEKVADDQIGPKEHPRRQRYDDHRGGAQRERCGPRFDVQPRRPAIDEAVTDKAAIAEREHPADRRHDEHQEAADADAPFPRGLARDVGQRSAPVDAPGAS